MKLFFTILFFTFQTPLAWGLYEQKNESLTSGETLSYIIYTEGDLFVVDRFKIGSDGWQEREEQQTFTQKAEALFYFKKISQNAVPVAPRASISGVASSRASVKIWSVKRQWDAQWESAYSQWVQSTITKTYFYDRQLPTDCADLVFATRWIFARNNGLPAAATLAGSGKIFSQDDGRSSWSKLSVAVNWEDDVLFRTALEYVMENTFTHSLMSDSYPVQINPSGIQAGGYYLVLRTESGHTRLIGSTQPNSTGSKVISFLSSDVPVKIRVLGAEPFSLRQPIDQASGGFLRFRWPVLNKTNKYELTDSGKMPFYSIEQFAGDFLTAYYKTVTTQMGIKDSPADYLKMNLDLVWQRLQSRIAIVQEGFEVCGASQDGVENCAEDSSNYENWSTPNRDATIQELTHEIYNTLWGYSKEPTVAAEFASWKDLPLEVAPGLTLRFESLINIFYYNLYSSDPRAPIPKRWGK